MDMVHLAPPRDKRGRNFKKAKSVAKRLYQAPNLAVPATIAVGQLGHFLRRSRGGVGLPAFQHVAHLLVQRGVLSGVARAFGATSSGLAGVVVVIFSAGSKRAYLSSSFGLVMAAPRSAVAALVVQPSSQALPQTVGSAGGNDPYRIACFFP